MSTIPAVGDQCCQDLPVCPIPTTTTTTHSTTTEKSASYHVDSNPLMAPGVTFDPLTNTYIDPNGPENPIHTLDVFSRGLPVDENYFSGFRSRQTEVEMTPPAMRQVMLGVEIRPYTLTLNPRAHLFPDKIEASVFSTKASLFDLILQRVGEQEAFNRRGQEQTFAYSEVHDVQKMNPSAGLIPWGFFKGSTAKIIGSEVWQVKRRDKRADAMVWFLDRKTKGLEGKPLEPAELETLPPREQMNIYRYLSDFGAMDFGTDSEEDTKKLIAGFQRAQAIRPFLQTRYYRVNYYGQEKGDLFLVDILPDERSSGRHWFEYMFLKGREWKHKLSNPRSREAGGNTQTVKSSGVNSV